jgi:hypothetical protein
MAGFLSIIRHEMQTPSHHRRPCQQPALRLPKQSSVLMEWKNTTPGLWKSQRNLSEPTEDSGELAAKRHATAPRGVIQALDGPAMGAVLYATRPGDQTCPIILTPVDPNGHFDIRFPAATAEVMVGINAPGFAFRLTRARLDDKDETFAVEQNGGILSIDAPAVSTKRRALPRPQRRHALRCSRRIRRRGVVSR